MKKVLFALLCGLCFYGATAQEINCKVENIDITSQESNRSTVISVDDDGAGGSLVVRLLTTSESDPYKDIIGYVIDHYDSNMKLVKAYTQKVNLSNNGIIGVIVKDGKITYIDFIFNESEQSFVCTAYTANTADLKFKKKQLFTLKESAVIKKIFGLEYLDSKFRSMCISADKSYFGVCVKGYDDKGTIVNRVYTFNTDSLTVGFTKEFRPDENVREFYISNFEISNDGNAVYLLYASSFDNKERKIGGFDDTKYLLTRVTSAQITTHVFEANANYPRELQVFIKNSRLFCLGFYSTKDSKSWTTGLCYYEFDTESLQVTNSKLNPFSAQFLTDKFGDKKKDSKARYSLRSVFIAPNNDIVVSAEEFDLTSIATPRSSIPEYHFNDIVSIRLDKSGTLLWARNINKEQVVRDKDISVSYTSFANGDDIYFFFNAGNEPKKLDDNRIEFKRDKEYKSSFYVLLVNKDGNFKYKPLLSYEAADQVCYSAAFGSSAKDGKSIFFTGGSEEQRKMMKISVE